MKLFTLDLQTKQHDMKTATISDFQKNVRIHLKSIENDQDVLILSGQNKKDFVLLTLQQFNAMQETAHLLSTQANAAHLLESIAQDKKSNALR
jgi:antitoxin YefM